MPGMDGFALLRAVRARDLDVPVILITGAPTDTTASDAVAYGALRCLTKPVEPSVLARQVVKATRLGRLARVKREALEALGTFEALPIVTSLQLSPNRQYRVSLRAGIRRGRLSDTMRVLLFWTDDWHRESEWFSWSLQR